MISRYHHRLVPAVVLLILACLANAASAIVIRHDVPDAAYIARESEFPAVFSLYRTKAGHNECIATLISPRLAMTAAHCARERSLLAAAAPGGQGFEVKIGGLSARIDRVIHHPGNVQGRAPDLALLRLMAPATHVAPLPLYRGVQEVGRVIVMPGWGGTGNGELGLGVEDGLFRVAENRVDRAEGHRLSWRFDHPAQGKAVTLEGISGPGDSGGPALIRTPEGWQVAGVSSSQDTMAGPEGRYGVEEYFVRVSDYAAWIDAHAAEVGPESSPSVQMGTSFERTRPAWRPLKAKAAGQRMSTSIGSQ